ncbi:MAG: SRPBCC family protein [Chitinophagales bacterium]
MSRTVKFLIALSIAFSLFLVSGFLLPNHYEVQRDIIIDASFENIYPYLSDLKKWEDWTAWSKKEDPSLQMRYEGSETGQGAKQIWKGDKMGDGELMLTESNIGDGVYYVMKMNEGNIEMKGSIVFRAAEPTQTKVLWTVSGQLGNNPIFRYFGLLMDNMIASDLEQGLTNLKTMVESQKIQE